MARVDLTWIKTVGGYLKTAYSSGLNILVNGENRYINFNLLSGASGYGIRDNNGTLQFKNSGGSWTDIGTGGGGTSDHGSLTGLGDDDHTQYALADGSRGSFATTAQGALADTALQPADVHAVATSGDYDDLSNKPDLTVFDNIEVQADQSSFPATGSADVLYLETNTGLLYRWTGSAYAVISAQLALGETSTTAYRGDRGKAAYDLRHSHSNKSILDNIQEALTTALKSGYDAASSWVSTNGATVLAHLANTSNPHSVDKTDVGLGNVPNVDARARSSHTGSQAISTITGLQAALDAKIPTSASINQNSHGFNVGDPLRHNGTNYVLAQADTAVNAEVIGVVASVTDSNNFVLQQSGFLSGLSGLTAGDVYWLSETVAGDVTTTQPSGAGEIARPVYLAVSATEAWILPYVGQEIDAITGTFETLTYDKAVSEFYDNGNAGGSFTIDWSNGNKQKITLDNASPTLAFSNVVDGQTLELWCEYSTAQATPTWSDIDYWLGGSAPDMPASASEVTIVTASADGTLVIASGEVAS